MGRLSKKNPNFFVDVIQLSSFAIANISSSILCTSSQFLRRFSATSPSRRAATPLTTDTSTSITLRLALWSCSGNLSIQLLKKCCGLETETFISIGFLDSYNFRMTPRVPNRHVGVRKIFGLCVFTVFRPHLRPIHGTKCTQLPLLCLRLSQLRISGLPEWMAPTRTVLKDGPYYICTALP